MTLLNSVIQAFLYLVYEKSNWNNVYIFEMVENIFVEMLEMLFNNNSSCNV